MVQDNISENYEHAEEIAIKAGKHSLGKSPWLFERSVGKRGFFVEMRKNDHVHPSHFAVECTDGAGTKIFTGIWSGDYRGPSIDAIMMNSNDMATVVHAFPSNVNIYIAVQRELEQQHMGEIMEGIRLGLERLYLENFFSINVGKLETASLDEMISGPLPNLGYDIGVCMTGFIRKEQVPNLDPKPGHLILGLESTGLHSNGYTGARHVLFTPDVESREEWKSQYRGRFGLHDKPDVLEGMSVLEALQVPTASYFLAAHKLGLLVNDRELYGVNITGNGLHNFNRAGKNVCFHITDPMPLKPIHKLLIQESGWNVETSYKKQNDGMGFAFVGPRDVIEESERYLNEVLKIDARIVGEVKKSSKSDLITYLHHESRKKPIPFVGYSA